MGDLNEKKDSEVVDITIDDPEESKTVSLKPEEEKTVSPKPEETKAEESKAEETKPETTIEG